MTAITGDARANLDFYTRVMGMRLVKRTVNQDDTSAYHLFYADGRGSPGTDLTFFDWPMLPANQPGAGSIGPIGLRVADERSLDWWIARFQEHGVVHGMPLAEPDRISLAFEDPEGQRLQLITDSGRPGGQPWTGSPVPPEHQVKGLYGVTLVSARPQVTAEVLSGVLGFTATGRRELPDRTVEHVFAVGPGGPGAEVVLQVPERARWGRPGRGGVHHVAFRVPDPGTQLEWREWIAASGLQPTPVIDRYYFRSVYFREPGGILFEIATDGPGFATDEPEASMGSSLALPPFLEPRRTEIEAGLQPLA